MCQYGYLIVWFHGPLTKSTKGMKRSCRGRRVRGSKFHLDRDATDAGPGIDLHHPRELEPRATGLYIDGRPGTRRETQEDYRENTNRLNGSDARSRLELDRTTAQSYRG